MGGIYVHIPFCRRKCLYCNFFSVADLRRTEELADALCRELSLRAATWPDKRVATVYFGGGTPSLLPAESVGKVLSRIRALFAVDADAEITLEANPEDITTEKLDAWLRAGINRLSLGVQSFQDETLAFMRRRHSGADAVRALETARRAGFANLTLDLIYGVPGRDDRALMRDVETAVGLQVRHVSAYALTREEGTALDVLAARGALPPPDDEMAARQYFLLADRLECAGLYRYEVSNFAAPGCRSRHNSAYWDGTPYLGIGPSAHSFDGRNERSWNVASIGRYLSGIAGGRIPCERETLSPIDRRNEMVMTALRTAEGLSGQEFGRRFGEAALRALSESAEPFLRRGQLEWSEGALRVTRAGWFFIDGIAADLFEVED